MLTNEDIKKLKEVLSTKEDFGQLRTEMNQNFAKVVTLDEFGQFKDDIKHDIPSKRQEVCLYDPFIQYEVIREKENSREKPHPKDDFLFLPKFNS